MFSAHGGGVCYPSPPSRAARKSMLSVLQILGIEVFGAFLASKLKKSRFQEYIQDEVEKLHACIKNNGKSRAVGTTGCCPAAFVKAVTEFRLAA
ncbi:hypothetical protein EVAR_77975_1 [Eumeta japonica]|uniref:Uncharacterized protein n=1 Tax=Eumeta variegata TaxID=151549 RepID=A0A4C1SZS7_EUMVA|nr:hypothetical protein EVAR_77975_1 [Eumeta japonica]